MASADNHSRKQKQHAFHEELAHPAVEIANHIVSPLTASLTIFGVHKMWQLPAARAWASAIRVLMANGQLRSAASLPRPSVGGLVAAASLAGVALLTRGTAAPASSTGVPIDQPSSAQVKPVTVPPLADTHQVSWYLAPPGIQLLRDVISRLDPLGHRPVPVGQQAKATAQPQAQGWQDGKAGNGTDQAKAGYKTDKAVPFSGAGGASPAPSASGQPAQARETSPHTIIIHDGDVDLAVLARLYSAEDAPLVAKHLSNAPTVKLVERNMKWLHDTYGWSWSTTIVSVTLALRMALAPLNISLLRNSLRMKLLMPNVQSLAHDITHGGGQGRAQAAKDLLALFRANGCHPLKHFIAFPVLLPPTILSIFGAIHNLSVSAAGMDKEGALWFPDLLAPDVSHLLPIASALTWLLNIEAGAGVHYHASPQIRSAVRIVAMSCWPLASTLPNGVLLFWVTSNLFALARAAATRPDAVRRLLKLPLRSQIAALSHLPRPVPY